MMNSKFNKVIWSINGIGILIIVIFGIYQIGKDIFRNLEQYFRPEFDQGLIVGSGARKAIDLDIDLQHIYYNFPSKISNSDYYFSEVIILDKYIPTEIQEELKKMNDMPRLDATINLMFFKSDRTKVYTLLDKPGYIESIDYPSEKYYYHRFEKTRDMIEKQSFILYEIAMHDTNGDSRINSSDHTSFYLSDLEGKNLEQITPDSLTFNNYWFTQNCEEIYFERLTSEGKIEINGRSRDLTKRNVYVYNFKKKKLEKFDDLEKIIDKMKTDLL